MSRIVEPSRDTPVDDPQGVFDRVSAGATHLVDGALDA
jgi:hypothetical protein